MNSGLLLEFHRTLTNGIRLRFNRLTFLGPLFYRFSYKMEFVVQNLKSSRIGSGRVFELLQLQSTNRYAVLISEFVPNSTLKLTPDFEANLGSRIHQMFETGIPLHLSGQTITQLYHSLRRLRKLRDKIHGDVIPLPFGYARLLLVLLLASWNRSRSSIKTIRICPDKFFGMSSVLELILVINLSLGRFRGKHSTIGVDKLIIQFLGAVNGSYPLVYSIPEGAIHIRCRATSALHSTNQFELQLSSQRKTRKSSGNTSGNSFDILLVVSVALFIDLSSISFVVICARKIGNPFSMYFSNFSARN
ncbi:hypothetical protein Tco_1301758 [Tanacetum coccineum]